jgi:hypothetical protein
VQRWLKLSHLCTSQIKMDQEIVKITSKKCAKSS